MISFRIFVCHSIDQKDQQEIQILDQLQEQLRAGGSEIVLYPGAISEEGFFTFLASELATCQWFICVQTTQASRSPQMRIAVNSALKLLAQKQLQGASRLILTEDPQEDTPETWSAIPAFDATQDAARALVKLRLALTTKQTVPSSPVAPSVSPPILPSSPEYDRPIATKPLARKSMGRNQPGSNNGLASLSKPPARSVPSSVQKNWSQLLPRKISRRAFTMGLSIVAGMVLGGGVAVLGELVLGGQRAPAASAGGLGAQTISPGTTLTIYHGHSAAVAAVAWASDGLTLASAGGDRTVQIWNGRNGQRRLTYRGHTASVNAVAWSPVAWSAPSQLIASGGGDTTVRIWSAPDGVTHVIYEGHEAQVTSINWSPGGSTIASASYDNTVQVWNAGDGSQIMTYTGHRDVVHQAVWSPGNNLIASASGDGTVQVWEPLNHGTLDRTYTGHKGSVNALVWDPNEGIIASGGSDGTVQVWQISNGQSLFTCTGHTDAVTALAMSPDGQFLVSSSADKTLRVWNAWNGGQQVLVYQGHSAPVYTVDWSSSGPYIASGGKDTTVRLWEGEA